MPMKGPVLGFLGGRQARGGELEEDPSFIVDPVPAVPGETHIEKSFSDRGRDCTNEIHVPGDVGSPCKQFHSTPTHQNRWSLIRLVKVLQPLGKSRCLRGTCG